MRRLDERSGELFSYVDLERRVPARHPLRAIRAIVNEAPVALDEEFRAIYASTFSKNRDRLLDGDIAAQFLAAILARPQVKRPLSNDHFSVDGTLIEAWCSMKSLEVGIYNLGVRLGKH